MRFSLYPLAATFLASPLAGQSVPAAVLEPQTARVAVLTVALYTSQANVIEASDTSRAVLATEVLRDRIAADLGGQLVPFPLVDSLVSSPASLQLSGGVPCHVRIACGREVAREAGASWVVFAKVSKTSNLIWLLTAQLVRVSTGDILIDDSVELKGDPAVMIPIGVRNLADRITRAVRAGGVVSNFPWAHSTPSH